MVETVYTPNAPVSKFPISQATKAGCLYFLSGQNGIDPVSGQLAGDTIEQAVRTGDEKYRRDSREPGA